MKVECIECTHLKEKVCAKNSKNGYNNCKKFKAIPMIEIMKEYKMLLLSKENPIRFEYLKNKIIEFNGGTI